MAKTGLEGFDWGRGRWANPAVPQARAEVIIASDWAPIRAFDDIVARAPESVYGDTLPVLRAADLRIVNLECALSGDASPVWKSGSVFKGRPEHIRGLTAVPFEAVTLANNHVFDYGTEAFRETLELLGNHSIRTVGAGMSPDEARRPLILEVKGVRIGIVNFSEGEDLTAAVSGPGVFGWDVDAVVGSIRALRPDVDIILVVCHGGVEYIPFPPPYLAEAYRRAADAGADLVIGHHAHVPQGIQFVNGVPVCYSLGNFVFHQETDLLYRKRGYLVKAGVSREGMSHLDIIPYGIGSESLRLLQRDERAHFFEALRRVTLPLAEAGGIAEAWHGFLRYYGIKGFRDEIEMILAKMDQEPAKGAAMLRNRVATMQHREHWIDAMTRIMDGTIDESPQWAYDLAVEWMTKKLAAKGAH
ncbi:MAG: CapA family protein [Syntrophobacterales bacterium]|nr:CapA family protein [Syntrophobacterales bacterium]